MRPLDRLSSIRAKLGTVIVFAVAMTILTMCVTLGFALRKFDRDRQFREVLGEARGVAAIGFVDGRPSTALMRTISRIPEAVVVLDRFGKPVVVKKMPVPNTTTQALAGRVDTGTFGASDYVGVPVVRGRMLGDELLF